MRSFLPATDAGQVSEEPGRNSSNETRMVPACFSRVLDDLVQGVNDVLCAGFAKDSKSAAEQCRLKADDPVTTGLVQMMLELEYDKGRSEEKNSLMDRLLEGLVTAYSESTSNPITRPAIHNLLFFRVGQDPAMSQPARSDYIETLLRSTVSSHVLEKIITLSPEPIYNLLFKMYFQGRISRLAGHPVANFVCTRVVERADRQHTETVVDEIGDALPGCIENSRTGVVQVLLEKVQMYKTRCNEFSKVNGSLLHAEGNNR